jgi:hypothetical protein
MRMLDYRVEDTGFSGAAFRIWESIQDLEIGFEFFLSPDPGILRHFALAPVFRMSAGSQQEGIFGPVGPEFNADGQSA